MVKTLETLVERYAPENVRKQLAKARTFRATEREARYMRRRIERELVGATMPKFPDETAEMAVA